MKLNKRYSWEKQVQAILRKADMDDIINQDTNVKHVLCILKEKLALLDQKNWHSSLWDDSRNDNGNNVRIYRLYKSQFRPEHYSDIRLELFDSICEIYPDFHTYHSFGKFCTVMNEEKIQTKLASTVTTMYKRRNCYKSL
jgi:hypothetical protein